ncbi:CDGSH iron-sulfur domain-containing protein [Streptomyces sp. TRM 70361]|uniref:CDGSH iron-sulfur domain-containing protein n=1 Tax=Streptomyces sp. TRM 70361 TaxID=3116553 RepID=UPI002E7BB3B6|nr:CDGSH iron-sulfur domain-containing protein [Streptomyces sp. TRM 70361]MEE1942080.1 CDGSH iron-sulfur domain-containing protein [Streptomyces sp. TRM 70361]
MAEETVVEPVAEPADRRARRVVVDPEGPVLIEGPVEVELPDGRTARSDRFVVAVCVCRRSHRYPWCDTSHRRRERRPRPAAEGKDPDRGPDGDRDT